MKNLKKNAGKKLKKSLLKFEKLKILKKYYQAILILKTKNNKKKES